MFPLQNLARKELRFILKDYISITICIINIISVDDLATQGSRASPAMTLNQFASR